MMQPARLLALICLAALSGCAPATVSGDVEGRSPTLATAAAEATAIVAQAQATALVLQARAQATVVMSGAGRGPAPSTVAPAGSAPPLAALPAATPAPAGNDDVALVSVGFAADGAYVIVQFLAPPRAAREWSQGNVQVVDETTGSVYAQIPVMPTLGPLIAHPARAGQIGYVMLENGPVALRAGAVVTVVLGDFRWEHVPVAGRP